MKVYRLKRQYDGQWEEIQRWAEQNLNGQWMWGSEYIDSQRIHWIEDLEGTMFIHRDEDAVLFCLRWM